MQRIFRLAAFVAGIYGATASAALAVPHAGDAAPTFSLPATHGARVSLAAYRNKPLYVNFFASWCGPCNEEAGTVRDLSAKYKRRGLRVLGVNEQENASKASDFARKYRWTFPVATDDDGRMGEAYGAIGLPVHVFIDKHGRIGTLRLGEMEPAEIEDAIKKIL